MKVFLCYVVAGIVQVVGMPVPGTATSSHIPIGWMFTLLDILFMPVYSVFWSLSGERSGYWPSAAVFLVVFGGLLFIVLRQPKKQTEA